MIEDKAVVGFDKKKLIEAFGGSVKATPRDSRETVPIILKALEAFVRAIDRMPEDKVNWSASQRQRPMGEFVSHIIKIVRKTFEELGPIGSPPLPQPSESPFTCFREIAHYGELVIEKYRTWVPSLTLAPLNAPISATAGAKSSEERLDILAGHIIHHLRQLYSILDSLGIAVDDRVPDSQWPSEYVLSLLW